MPAQDATIAQYGIVCSQAFPEGDVYKARRHLRKIQLSIVSRRSDYSAVVPTRLMPRAERANDVRLDGIGNRIGAFRVVAITCELLVGLGPASALRRVGCR